MRASGAPSASTVASVIASASGTSRVAARTSRGTARSDRPPALRDASGGMSGRRGTGGASLNLDAFVSHTERNASKLELLGQRRLSTMAAARAISSVG